MARLAKSNGGDANAIALHLRKVVASGRAAAFISEGQAAPGLVGLTPGYAALLGGAVLLIWFVSLLLQGEDAELDVSRRRHPMWEWVLSYPV